MPSVSQVGESFCIFQPSGCAETTAQSLAFSRRTITQTSAGDTVQTFVSFATFAGDLQPQEAGLKRMIHGQVFEIDYHFYVLGNPDIRESDRCTISGGDVEVVSVRHFGGEHAEIDLLYMGR